LLESLQAQSKVVAKAKRQGKYAIYSKEDKAMSGDKHDKQKLRMDLIPILPLWGLAKILTLGAKIYGYRNWEHGFEYSRLYGAALRHLTAWWNGEDLDPESGEHHLLHCLCNIVFLAEYELRPAAFKKFDDRPYKGG